MTSPVKAAGLAGILVVASTTARPALTAAQPKNTVRQGQPVTTELSANASAMTYWVSESDGCDVVTTVDTVIGQDGDAEAHAVVRFSTVLLPGQSQLISVPFCQWAAAAGSAHSSCRGRDRGCAGARLHVTRVSLRP